MYSLVAFDAVPLLDDAFSAASLPVDDAYVLHQQGAVLRPGALSSPILSSAAHDLVHADAILLKTINS